jgi:hypothetical protein
MVSKSTLICLGITEITLLSKFNFGIFYWSFMLSYYELEFFSTILNGWIPLCFLSSFHSTISSSFLPFFHVLCHSKLKPKPYNLSMDDQTITKPLGLIKYLKILVHGIPYSVTYIVIYSSVLVFKYSMLSGRP